MKDPLFSFSLATVSVILVQWSRKESKLCGMCWLDQMMVSQLRFFWELKFDLVKWILSQICGVSGRYSRLRDSF